MVVTEVIYFQNGIGHFRTFWLVSALSLKAFNDHKPKILQNFRILAKNKDGISLISDPFFLQVLYSLLVQRNGRYGLIRFFPSLNSVKHSYKTAMCSTSSISK